MENRKSKRNGMKVKLISSLCMLLIASLMVVGSTYAWIVMSTAPEVADIPITVGANGALEIKLNIEESADRNSQFRNIVEFGDNTYGLDNVVLLPAILNSSFANGYVQIPKYGYDGLVAGQLDNAVVGTLGEFGNDFYQSTENGVRVLGTSSGISERQVTFNNAIKNAKSAISSAKSSAQNSLKNDSFMSLVLKMNETNPTYTKDDVAVLDSMLTGLEKSVEYLEEAYKQLIFASAASDNGQEDVVSQLVQQLWGTGDLTLDAITTSGKIATGGYSVDVDATVLEGLRALKTTDNNVGEARRAYNDLDNDADSYSSTDISPILEKLVNKSSILVNDGDIGSVDPADIMTNGAVVTMQDGAGVYVEIADQIGNYSVAISSTVTMETETSKTNPYLTFALGEIEEVGAPGADPSTLPLENFYGYIIDLCFKTNAESSNLLLQTDATDRIDNNNSTEETMGAGSFMKFEITAGADITDEQVKAIMKCFNIVFFNTDTNVILGTASLNADNAVTGADGSVTAELSMDNDTQVITALTQYNVHNISVLVCLDAQQLMNEHVSATTATSVKGILNLQFASDANLVAMPYEQ